MIELTTKKCSHARTHTQMISRWPIAVSFFYINQRWLEQHHFANVFSSFFFLSLSRSLALLQSFSFRFQEVSGRGFKCNLSNGNWKVSFLWKFTQKHESSKQFSCRQFSTWYVNYGEQNNWEPVRNREMELEKEIERQRASEIGTQWERLRNWTKERDRLNIYLFHCDCPVVISYPL